MSLYLSDRHWYQSKRGELVTLPFGKTNHTQDVLARPEFYGVNSKELVNVRGGDYDPVVLLTAFRQGWVRIRFDRHFPDQGTNIEGGRWRDIVRAVRFITKHVPGIWRLVVVQRDETAEQSFLWDRDQIDLVVKHGYPPRVFSPAAQ